MARSLFKRKQAPNGSPTNGNGSENGYLIDLRGVVKTYETPAGDFVALKHIDLQIKGGEFVAVIGKSGSGKSTLINMISGIDRPTAGEIFVGGTAVHNLSEGEMALWRGRNLGIVFQFFQLLPTLTLVENIMLPMDFVGMYTPRERRERAMYLLEQVEMTEHAHKLPTAISGGQQQRVAIARALANNPPILVADEPTGNLDSKTSENVFRIFENMIAEGKTVLMVTHDDDQAKRVTRAVIVADGEIVNEYLARALPSLSQQQLAAATKELQPLRFAPGEPIITQDSPADCFYIVTKGEVNVYLHEPDGGEMFVDRMGPGEFFGEIAVLEGGTRTATVRAARYADVEVVALSEEVFISLVDESQMTREEMKHVMFERRKRLARTARGERYPEDDM
jgi:ABC-type lipoprotein export system ATPase subunit